jgi:uncharacterized protein (DUF1810 family)
MDCTEAILGVQRRSALDILGSPDDAKLRSCATLFAFVSPAGSVFDRVLDRYYEGGRDGQTLALAGVLPQYHRRLDPPQAV